MALLSRISLIAALAVYVSCIAYAQSVHIRKSEPIENLGDLDTNLEEARSKSPVNTQESLNDGDQRQVYAKVVNLEESIRALNGKIQHLENANKKLADKLNKFVAESTYKSSTTKPSIITEAINFIDNNKPEAAVKILLEYISANPQSELDEAYYFLGMAYSAQNLHQKAGASFLKCYKTYPNKPRASESLLHVAKALRNLNNYEKACSILDRLEKEYPQRSEVEKASGIAEKKLNKCEPYQTPASTTLEH